MRTAVAASNLSQARAARRRPRAAAAQREPPEAVPAAGERAEQRSAVFLVSGRDGLPTAGVEGRHVRGCQKLPSRSRLHGVRVSLRLRETYSRLVGKSITACVHTLLMHAGRQSRHDRY